MQTRVAVAGFGSMGKNHARVLSTQKDFQLVGVYDSHQESLQGLEKGLSITSLDELMSLRPDYVVVAVPTDQHFDLTETLIRNKLNVLVEKPLTQEARTSKKLLDLSIEFDVLGYVGHIERFNPAAQRAKVLIDNGLIGQVISISTIRHGPIPSRVKDVGVIFDLVTHDIDLAQWLGGSNYDDFSIKGNVDELSKHESIISTLGRLKTGCLVTHSVNWISPFKARKVLILGAQGALEINTLNSELIHYELADSRVLDESVAKITGGSVGRISNLSFDKEEALVLEHMAFRELIRGKENMCVDFEQGYKVVEIAEKMRNELFSQIKDKGCDSDKN
jgi:UDP-N-acetylglucosamine 3-dehydrogenase